SSMSKAVHDFFNERGFIHVHTPIITASDCEGAGEMFRVTTLSPENHPVSDDGSPDYSKDFFGKQAYLTVSGQLEGEIFASALGNIYTFGPTFRAENSNTSRHLSEFWMIEPEMAFADINDNMDTAEDFLKFIFTRILENNEEDLSLFDKFIEKGLLDSIRSLSETEYARISYSQAVKELRKSGGKFQFPVEWGTDLQSEHEKFLTETVFKKPVIVIDYPKEIKAFYMYLNDDEKTVRAMDVLVPKIGEIIGGSQREHRYETLKKRLIGNGLNEENYWWYSDLRKYGTVPHSGFGLGFERLILYATGMENIRDVIPFPRTPGNAEF
ncbi:MAG: asparagine--tRNA ligase, partial [Fibrobacterota bacterium]